MSIFDELTGLAKRSLAGEDVLAVEFLDVCRHVVTITDKFGASFVMIRSDINGNIDRLDTARQRDPQRFAKLFEIPLDEISRGVQGGKYSDSRGLLWLSRAMEFMSALLAKLYADRSIALSTAATEAYHATLYNFHSWLTVAAFEVALKLVPSRETFFEKLGATDEAAMQSMHAFLQAFEPVLAQIAKFLKEHGLDDPTPA